MTSKVYKSWPLSFHGLISQGTIFLSQLSVVALTSHKLELSDLGKYTVAVGLVGILNFVIPSGLTTAIQNLRNLENSGERDDLFVGLVLLPFFLIEFCLGAILLQIFSITELIQIEPNIFFLCLGISNLALVNGFLYTILRLQGRTKTSLYTESISSLFIFCAVLFTLLTYPNLRNFLLSSILSQLFTLIVTLIVVFRKSKLRIMSKYSISYNSRLRGILLFSYKTSGIALLSFFSSQLPIFIFGRQSQLRLAAEYSRSILICTIPLTILFTIYSRLYYLPLLKTPRIRLTLYFDKVIVPMLILVNTIYFFISLFSQQIIHVLLGARWLLSPKIISVTAIGAAFQFIFSVLFMFLESRSKFRYLAAATGIQAIFLVTSAFAYLAGLLNIEWIYASAILVSIPVIYLLIRKQFTESESSFLRKSILSSGLLLQLFCLWVVAQNINLPLPVLVGLFIVMLSVLFFNRQRIRFFLGTKDLDNAI